MHTLVVAVAKYLIIVPVIVAAAIWFKLPTWSAKKKFVIEALLAAILAFVLAKIGSKLYYDTRPFVAGHFTPYIAHANDNGFPSDHTLLSSLIAFVVWRYNKVLGAGLLMVALAIGLSRVIAGVHHLADILGSIVFALAGTAIAVAVIKLISRPKASPLATKDQDQS